VALAWRPGVHIYIYIYTYAVFVIYIYIYTVDLPRFSGGGDLYDWTWLFDEGQPNAAWVVTQEIWHFLFPELHLERDAEGVVRLRQVRPWDTPLRMVKRESPERAEE